MPMRRSLLSLVLLGVMATLPAGAAPKDALVVAVFRTSDCRSEVCVPGSDRQVTDGAVVAGAVQIHVSAAADLGLEWVRLEARTPGDPEWYCLEFWNAGRATSFRQHRTWITPRWTDPTEECDEGICSSCAENSAHQHGEPSANVTHEIRVLAHEQGANVSSTPDAESPPFRLQLANGGAAPVWSEAPKVAMRDGRPVVHLAWAPSDSPGVAEYRFTREDADATETTFAVAADDPSRQGCTAVGAIVIRCVDHSVPRYGGSFRYAVAAYRTAPAGAGQRCALSAARCVRSAMSSIRTVTVQPAAGSGAAPLDEMSPAAPGSTTASTQPAVDAPMAPPVVEAEPGDEDQIAAPEPTGPGGKIGALSVLAALLVAGAVGASTLVRRRARKEQAPPASNPVA